MESEKDFLISNENHLNSNSEVQVFIQTNSAQSSQKTRKGILDLLRINALVCGVEIVSSCAFTHIPPLLLRSGFSEFIMTIILGVAPFVDMITVPVLAEWSDNSTLKIGRRRPVIMGLSAILILSLLLIPCSSKISLLLVGDNNSSLYLLLLAVGVILLDYSCQAIFNPCEALLSDMMTTCDRKSQTLGFSLYSACLSLGCIIGYLIVCIKWTSIIPLDLHQDQMYFLMVTILLIPCILLTLSNKEVPNKPSHKVPNLSKIVDRRDLKYIKKFHALETHLNKEFHPVSNNRSSVVFPNKIEKIYSWNAMIHTSLPLAKLVTFIDGVVHFVVYISKEAFFSPIGCYKRIQMSPVVIQRVFFVEFFGWTALHCHDRFFTDFVGQYIYEGDPNAKGNTSAATLYDEGIQMGSWCLFLQSLSACLYAFFLQQHLVHLIGPRVVFIGGIFVFFFSMVLTLVLPSVPFLKIATGISGIGTAALTTTPNMLVTLYFQKKEVYMKDILDDEEHLPTFERGIGSEVAVLDMAYYLSQIVLSFFLGPLVEFFKSSLMYIVVSTVASGIAFYCASRVVFTPQDHKLVLEGKF